MSNDLEWTPLSTLAEINPRKDIRISDEETPVSFIPMGDVSESGEWVGRQIRPLREVNRGYTAFRENDVLFAKITPCMENGKGCHVRDLKNGVGFGSTEFHVLRARNGVSPRYLYHWTQTPTLRLKAESAMSGSAGQQRVKTWFFDEFTVPAFSLPEQRRIADVLDTVDAAIRETDAVIAKQEQVKTGLLQDLLTRGLDAEGRLRDPAAEPGAFRETELGELPSEWHIHRFEDVIAEGPQNGLYKPKSAYTNGDEGFPIVRIDSFYNGKLTAVGNLRRLDLTASERLTYQLEAGDILINRVNSRGFIGKNAIVPELDEPTVFESNIMRLKVDQDTILPGFLNGLMNTPIVLRQLQVRAKDAVAQSSINQQDVNECLIPTPGLSEQRRIVRRLRVQEMRIDDEKAYQGKLQRLKTGLMQDLLTGRVRVPDAEEQINNLIA